MDITALHIQFEKLGWKGVATFAQVVRSKRYGGLSMGFLRRTCGISLDNFNGGEELYTVEDHLSDLLSRKALLDEDEIQWNNKNLEALANILQKRPVLEQ